MALQPAEDRAARDSQPTASALESWRDRMRAGTRLAAAGEPERAASCFRAATRKRPDHAPTLHAYASMLLRAGQTDAAGRQFKRLVELTPDSPQAWHGLGLACHAQGRITPALEAFRQATRLAPAAWPSWQSIADITPDEGERIAAIDSAARSLAALAEDPHATPDTLLRTCHALGDAHRFEDLACFIGNNFSRFSRKALAYERLGHTLYARGAFRQAFGQLKLALAATPCPDTRPSVQHHDFDPARAAEALGDICAILSGAGIVSFLAAGTLLGFMRDGAPLAHDRDVDLGVFADDTGPDMASLIRHHPALMLARQARPGDRYFALTHKGIGVDIFLYKKQASHALCGFSHLPGDIQWRFTDFQPVRSRFEGLACTIPDKPERYLAETYGPGWAVPDRGFASAVSSPALYATDPFARACYSAVRARRALLAGNLARARALASQSPVQLTFPRHAEDQPR